MATIAYKRTSLTGGASHDLDAIDGATLSAGDFAFVLVGGILYTYEYKDYGTPPSENPPYIIVPNDNPGNFAWQLQVQPGMTVISSDTTYYIAPTGHPTTPGNDSTGDGTTGTPWATLGKALDFLKDKWINDDVYVTIYCKLGTYASNPTINIRHPQGRRLKIEGEGSSTTIIAFIGGGLYVHGELFSLSKITLQGLSSTSNTGLRLYDASTIYSMSSMKIDVFDVGIWLDPNTFIEMSGTNLIEDCTTGINALHSSYSYLSSATTIDCNSLTGSVGIYARHSSHVYMNEATVVDAATEGIFAEYNAFINADNATYSSASPTPVTGDTPTYGNKGSWIYDSYYTP